MHEKKRCEGGAGSEQGGVESKTMKLGLKNKTEPVWFK